MSLLKYINRLQRMDYLLTKKATGNAEEFAEKLGISRSQLMQDLKELRELGAPIEFCAISQSYKYTGRGSLKLNLGQVRGGKNIFDFFNQSRMTGHSFYNLAKRGLLRP